MKRRWLFVGAAVALMSSSAQPASRAQLISVQEAKRLVATALPSKTRRLPDFEIEGGDSEFPHFYLLSVTWAGAPNGSMNVGSYYVDKSTGDVWNAPMECQEESSPALRILQARIRRTIGLSESEYRKIKRKGPLCP